MRGQKRYHGLVQNVRNNEGNVKVDVLRMDSHRRFQPGLYVKKFHPGLTIVPEEGWLVTCYRGPDGEHYVDGVTMGSEAYGEETAIRSGHREERPENEHEEWLVADDLEPGTFLLQLDKQSGLKYTWNEDEETYDLTIRCGGDMTLSAGGEIEEDTGTMFEDEDEFTAEEDA